MTENLLIAVLGGGNLILFIKFLIERHDAKKAKTEENEPKDIRKSLKKVEKDGLRTQLLLMILMKPGEKQEILTIGEHYFSVLKGNWYMTSMFNNWLKTKKIAEPDWFDSKGGE